MILHVATITVDYDVPHSWTCTHLTDDRACRESAVAKIEFTNQYYTNDATCAEHAPTYFEYCDQHSGWKWMARRQTQIRIYGLRSKQ